MCMWRGVDVCGCVCIYGVYRCMCMCVQERATHAASICVPNKLLPNVGDMHLNKCYVSFG